MATCVVTSTMCDPSTTPLQSPGSFIRFTLRNFLGFIPRVAGTNILAEIQIDAYPNSLGVVSQVLTTNTSITPQNTFYTAEVWSNGRPVDSANYIFNSDTDLSTASQINPPTIITPGLIFENNGVLNSSQNILNLESTNGSVGITDEGNGNINLSVGADDGIIDATSMPGADIGAKINAAVAILTATAGGQIFVPGGVYPFSNTIYLPRSVKLVGASAYATQLQFTNTTGWSVVVGDSAGGAYGNSPVGYPEGAIEDLSLIGPGNTNSVGGIFFGGSNGTTTTVAGFPNDPSTILAPSTNYGDHFCCNRVRITRFGVGVSWGNNAWSNTFSESVLTSNQTGIYFEGGTNDSGEKIVFQECSIQNSTTGLLIASSAEQDVDFFLTNCSLDYNSSWAVQNLSAITAVTLGGCHVEQAAYFVQNYGYFSSFGSYYTNASANSTWLFDNQNADGFEMFGGSVFNVVGAPGGVIINPSSQPSLWVGVLLNGNGGGAMTSVGGLIDPVGNALLKTLQVTTTVNSYNGYPTFGGGIPSIVGYFSLDNQQGNFNLGTPVSIANPSARGVFRVSWAQALTIPATSTSSTPTFTIGWVDPHGNGNTKQIVTSTTGNSLYCQQNGSLILITGAYATTLAVESYASGGTQKMTYSFGVTCEALGE